jgi:hypothetical protein
MSGGTRRKSILAGLGFVLLFALIACDRVLKVAGKVHDNNGTPLENVTVILQAAGRAPHKTLTTKDGSFTVGIVGADPDDTKLSFQLQGYETLEKGLGGQHSTVLDVTLERDLQYSH